MKNAEDLAFKHHLHNQTNEYQSHLEKELKNIIQTNKEINCCS
jgi:hypothetical protein